MNFHTIYSSADKSEISILENLFRDEGIEYRIQQDKHEAAGGEDQVEKRIQVEEKDRDKAKELLDQTGFLRVGGSTVDTQPRRKPGRWVFFALAALILVIIALILGWFMNPE